MMMLNLGENDPVGSYEETIQYFEMYLSYAKQFGEEVEDEALVQKAVDDIKAYIKNTIQNNKKIMNTEI